jgi:hypothetical protein
MREHTSKTRGRDSDDAANNHKSFSFLQLESVEIRIALVVEILYSTAAWLFPKWGEGGNLGTVFPNWPLYLKFELTPITHGKQLFPSLSWQESHFSRAMQRTARQIYAATLI